MANTFSKNETVFFEQVLEKFDSNNITAKNVGTFDPPMVDSERANYIIWRPIPYISRTTSGIDQSAQFGDITQLSVPAQIDNIENVTWKMNAQELNDEQQRDREAESAAQALSAAVDKSIATVVGLTGTLVVPITGALAGYDDIAEAEALMLEQEVPESANRLCMINPRDYRTMAGDLASRQTMAGRPDTAYGRSMIGNVAGFDTNRASFLPRLAAAAGGGAITVTGDQEHIPVSTAPNPVGNGQHNIDNRGMNLVVSTTASVAVGDAFTIADVLAISHIKKESTGQLKTFRVVEVVDGTNLTIYPAIVPLDGAAKAQKDYANVDTGANGGAAIVFLNTAAAQTNIFYVRDSVEIERGKLSMPDLDMAGVNTTRAMTDSGIEIIFSRQGEIDDLTAKYRLTIFFGATNLQPEMNGIIISGQ